MRRLLLILADVALILVALVLAVTLRENFELSLDRLANISAYAGATAGMTLVLFPSLGMHRTIWRLSRQSDYLRISWAMSLVVLAAVVVTFAFNRLDGVARSLPLLHMIVGCMILGAARALARQRHIHLQAQKKRLAPLKIAEADPVVSVLLVGVGPLAETYLQMAGELGGRVRIAGLLSDKERHVGRIVSNCEVLGRPENVREVLDDLGVHGQTIDRIVVTVPAEDLGDAAKEALRAIEQSGEAELRFVMEDLGFAPKRRANSDSTDDTTTVAKLGFEIDETEIVALADRRYWLAKRTFDVVLSATLLFVLWPLMLVIGYFVAACIGSNAIFWQQRPGLGGRTFLLYKFRSMVEPRDRYGRALSDAERTSRLGTFLRRTRIDEFPQLYNILRGDMSFVGPRPLLSREQSPAYRARLLVRPGLTGWAQVVGGREISVEDKVALDVWYVRNASLRLDFEIVVRTLSMLLFGERTYQALIDKAWLDLLMDGVLKGDLALSVRQRFELAV